MINYQHILIQEIMFMTEWYIIYMILIVVRVVVLDWTCFKLKWGRFCKQLWWLIFIIQNKLTSFLSYICNNNNKLYHMNICIWCYNKAKNDWLKIKWKKWIFHDLNRLIGAKQKLLLYQTPQLKNLKWLFERI